MKATRSNDYYLTITESKRRFNKDDTPYYEKHKIFLYKEDFEKFVDALTECVDHVQDELLPENDDSVIGVGRTDSIDDELSWD